MIQPKIVQGQLRKFIGQSLSMSVSKNRTGELWRSFMPRSMEIANRVGGDFISLQIYPVDHHLVFNPDRVFKKWALVEVSAIGNIPHDMERFTLEGGLYAVFEYLGASGDPSIFEYIYGKWIPNSAYELDDRPHFEVLGTNYRNNDANSQEELWIPIKKL